MWPVLPVACLNQPSAALPTDGLVCHLDDAVVLGTNPSKIIQWTDKSGSGNHFAQANESHAPVDTRGGVGTARFTGNAWLLCPRFFSTNRTAELFMVAKTDSVGGWNTISEWGGDGDTSYWRNSGGAICFGSRRAGNSWSEDGACAMSVIDINVDQVTSDPIAHYNAWVNGAVRVADGVTGGVANWETPNFALGYQPSWPAGIYHGYLAEVVVYDHILTSLDRASVTAYLRAKWGTP